MGRLVAEGGARIMNTLLRRKLPEEEQLPKALYETYGLTCDLGYIPTISYGQNKTTILIYSAHFSKTIVKKEITTIYSFLVVKSLHYGNILTAITIGLRKNML
ncbi:hypothetical protein MFRU_039g00420 [Monilinia fructicola]|nr:hypothetical protein MFRU_039g00420 [Monilinia fructicola]